VPVVVNGSVKMWLGNPLVHFASSRRVQRQSAVVMIRVLSVAHFVFGLAGITAPIAQIHRRSDIPAWTIVVLESFHSCSPCRAEVTRFSEFINRNILHESYSHFGSRHS